MGKLINVSHALHQARKRNNVPLRSENWSKVAVYNKFHKAQLFRQK
jgi:hypothetical protein